MLRTKGQRAAGFTLVEIMIAVMIILIVAAIAIPNYRRASKRAQATSIKNDLRLIDDAMNRYAADNQLMAGATVTWEQAKIYLKPSTALYATGASVISRLRFDVDRQVDEPITTPTGTREEFSGVIDPDFWAPFVLDL